MTQQQAIQLLEKFALQNYQADHGMMASIPEGGEPDANLNYATMIASGEISFGMAGREDNGSSFDNYSGFLPRPDVQRALSSFSPFSPDPNMSISEGKRRESRLDSLPHPSKAYAPGFHPLQSHEVRGGGSSPNGLSSGNRLSPSSSRPSSTYYGFADNSDPPALLGRVSGRAEVPISRPSSGRTSSPQGTGVDMDSMRDLNHTLANLDLSANAASRAGQFHLTTNA
jgi:hypothetical protein